MIFLDSYEFICQNIVKSMIVREIKRHLDEGDSDGEEEIISSGGTFILTPLQIVYDSGSDDDN